MIHPLVDPPLAFSQKARFSEEASPSQEGNTPSREGGDSV